MKKILKRIIFTMVGVIAAVVVVGGAVWLIEGRSPQAVIVSHALKKLLSDT